MQPKRAVTVMWWANSVRCRRLWKGSGGQQIEDERTVESTPVCVSFGVTLSEESYVSNAEASRDLNSSRAKAELDS